MMAHIFITATGDCSIVQGCCFLRMYIPHISDIKKIYVVAMQSTRNDMEMPEFQELWRISSLISIRIRYSKKCMLLGGENMESIKILRQNPEWLESAACWFHQKWKVPVEAYRESMRICVENVKAIPQWYIVADSQQRLIAGAGVIENDFHDRPDLSPNVCALFVEEKFRKKGIARYILNFIRKDLGSMGIETLYLVTDHTDFYEKCGWQFLTMVHDKEGLAERMYCASTYQ